MRKILFITAIFAALALMAFWGGPTRTYTIDASADSTITVVMRSDQSYSVTVWNDTLWGTMDAAVFINTTNSDTAFTILSDSIQVDSSFHTVTGAYWPYERLQLQYYTRQIDSGIVYIEVFSWDFLNIYR